MCLLLTTASVLSAVQGGACVFQPGEVWLDTAGKPIQAHGGGILHHDGVYYWYGENKDGPTLEGQRVDVIGVSCYRSTDLCHWSYEGLALKAVAGDPEHDLHPSKVCERPKVLYNAKTGKFVMWMHIDQPGYQYARVGTAVSDTPKGPFTFLGSQRPNGGESRDMTLFQDDDGAAYLVFGTGWHTHVQIARLSDDYLSLTGEHVNILERKGPPDGREAPALFKRKGKYYLITSGTTGWHQNPTEYAVADDIMGPWTTAGDPCSGANADTTYHSQSTFVLPVAGMEDTFIYLGDRWNPENLRDSRYVWLPIRFEGDTLRILWRDTWTLDDLR